MNPRVLSVLGAAFLAAAASAQYRFTAVADFPADPFPFIQEPPINHSGEVAFMRPAPGLAPAAEGLFVSHGKHEGVRTVVPDGFVEFRTHGLAAGGRVAFIDEEDGNVYRAEPNGRRVLIAEPDPDPEFEFFAPSINRPGTVAVIAQLNEDGDTAIFAGRGGDVTVISDAETGPLNFHSPPVINEHDDVAFSAFDLSGPGGGVYVFRRGTITRLYDNGSDPVINDRGVLAFTRFGTTPGSSSILRGDGGSLTTIAASGGAFVSVFANGINDSGLVAFRAGLATGGQAIYVGDGHKPVRVAGTGDPVLGRTVATVSAASINDRGELAMHIRFSDDTSAIVRASPQ